MIEIGLLVLLNSSLMDVLNGMESGHIEAAALKLKLLKAGRSFNFLNKINIKSPFDSL